MSYDGDDRQRKKQYLQTLANQHRKKLFEEGLFADFTIACVDPEDAEGNRQPKREFRVHRAILAARSKYFETMLSTSNGEFFEESRTGLMRIGEFAPEVMEAVLAFLYYAGDELPLLKGNSKGSLESLKELLRAADFFQIDELKEICERRLVAALSPENALELLVFADSYSTQNQHQNGISNSSQGGIPQLLKTEAIRFVNANRAKILASSSEGASKWKAFLRAHPALFEALYEDAMRVYDEFRRSSIEEQQKQKRRGTMIKEQSETELEQWSRIFEKLSATEAERRRNLGRYTLE